MINVTDAKDCKRYKKTFSNVHNIKFEELESAKKNSCIVVEDIIQMTKKDEGTLRQAINYQMHHKSQKIICATHSIFKTNLFSILLFFHFIIVTSASANVPTLRNLFRYFKIDPIQESEWIEKFKKLGNGQQGVYFYFNCSNMTFHVSNEMLFKKTELIGTLGEVASTSTGIDESRMTNLHKHFSQIVSHHPMKNEATSVFTILIRCLKEEVMRDKDLTVIFMDKKTGCRKLISVVDYIFTLLSEKSIVSPSIGALHNFIKTICHIPKTLVRNKYMREN